LKTHHAFPIVGVTLLFLSLSPARAEVYKWVDRKGTVHYTDDPDQLPEPRRSQVLRELEEKLQKERERRKQLRQQGIHVPTERLPPPPPPRPPVTRSHPAKDRLERRQKSREKWQALSQKARDRVTELEKKCEELRTKRDLNSRDRLTHARPGANQRYQKTLAAYERCQENLKKARRYLEVELPEQARKSGVPPGWVR
jgi:hypothetical protein